MIDNNNLKIVLVGPSLSGKTSLINTMFLGFSNPSYYINNNSIPLTKYFEIFTFDYNGIKVGVFDLAGQENQLWFNENVNIFNKADMIILVFAASEKIEVINSFLEYIHDIKKILDLNECKIVCLLHKCDLESETKIFKKIKYFKNTLSYGKEIDFFMTSISQGCYTKTFIVFSKILDFLNKNSITKSEFRKIMSELKILLRLEERAYSFEKLRKKFNLKDERPLKILNKLGFIKKSGNYYIITERGL
ncbi:MAG: GTPase domain-containing protein, partial [Promethearchaeota archaeon]